jgi:hypothetical protein
MPYIAFDLDALNQVPNVARACRMEDERITHGLVQLWAYCFREGTDRITRIHLLGFFGADAADALAAFGFLEPLDGAFRVRGAERYLRIREARSAGGKKASGNLKRGREPAGAQPEALSGSAPAQAGTQPEGSPGSAPALHRAPSTEHQETLEPLAGLLPAKEKKPESDPRRKPLSDALCADFLELRGEKYDFSGTRDGKALRELLKKGTPEQVRAKWRRGLVGSGLPSNPRISTLIQLSARWNELAGEGAASPPAKVLDLRRADVECKPAPLVPRHGAGGVA